MHTFVTEITYAMTDDGTNNQVRPTSCQNIVKTNRNGLKDNVEKKYMRASKFAIPENREIPICKLLKPASIDLNRRMVNH